MKEDIVDKILPYLTRWYALVIGLVIVYWGTTSIRQYRFAKRHGCKPIPQMKGWLFSIPLLINLLKKKSKGLLPEFVVEIFDKEGSTFFLLLAGVKIYVTKEPENMKAILASQFNDFALGTRHEHFKPLLGDGIFTLDGEGWKHSRAMLRPQFAREQVSHVNSLESHLQLLAKHISRHNGEIFNLQDLFFKFTLDTATEFLFGESVQTLCDEYIGELPAHNIDGKAEFGEAFNISQAYLSSRSYSQMFYWLINTPDFRRNNAKVHKFAKYYVNLALNSSQEELDKKSKDGYIFLYELVKQTRDAKVLQDQLLNILIAGRDTTAGLLSFTFYELARNPHIWEKLKTEVYKDFGKGSKEDVEKITFESLKKCEYLKYVINEGLRLYPSVPINFRVSTKDTTLPVGGGSDGQSPFFIPKGSTVAYSVYATHRSEEYYGKDALDFKPERWNDMKKLGWAFLPFNGGPRICLGQQFALTEASYIITRLAQLFPNLELRDTRPYPPLKCCQLTMSHQDGVYVSLTQ